MSQLGVLGTPILSPVVVIGGQTKTVCIEVSRTVGTVVEDLSLIVSDLQTLFGYE